MALSDYIISKPVIETERLTLRPEYALKLITRGDHG